MVTVALIGADGAGKTSVARALERSRDASRPRGDVEAMVLAILRGLRAHAGAGA